MCFVTVGLRGLKQLLVHSDLLSSLQDLGHSATSDRHLMVGGVKLRKLILYEFAVHRLHMYVGNYNLTIPYQITKFLKIWNFGPNLTNNINSLQGCIL